MESADLQSPTPPSVALKVLDPPQLSFNDTGFSITDGITKTGFWTVSSANDIGWEFSLDLGVTWTRGEGAGFDVLGDGSKTIWVRARDDFGNTSEIVVAHCTLDTMAPAAPSATLRSGDQAEITRLSLGSLEPGSLWDYSIDQGQTWRPGDGQGFILSGNTLLSLQIRQQDQAGNVSMPISIDLSASGAGWRELSGDPMLPTQLGTIESTILVHGEIVKGDADYAALDVPEGFKLKSAKWVFYESKDRISFYAMQRKALFDAGTDVRRMLSFGHFGPEDLGRNLLDGIPADQLGAGPLVIWINQTGSVPTRYALEVLMEPIR